MEKTKYQKIQITIVFQILLIPENKKTHGRTHK